MAPTQPPAHNNPHIIPFQTDELPTARPSTHRYPTRACNGAHIISNIMETHAIKMVLEAPTMPDQHQSQIYDSAWDIDLNIHITPTRTDNIKSIWSLRQSIVNPHNKDTGNLMSYPQLIKTQKLSRDGS